MSSVVEVKKTIQKLEEDFNHIVRISKIIKTGRIVTEPNLLGLFELIEKAKTELDGLGKTAKTSFEIWENLEDEASWQNATWVRWDDKDVEGEKEK